MKNTPASGKTAVATGQPSAFQSYFPLIAIPVIIVVSVLLYIFVLGAKSNFDEDNHPVNILGTVHEGGFIVPILMSMFLMVLVFSIERFFTITKATGQGSVAAFVRRIQGHLSANNLNAALQECDRQRGSVGNVVQAALKKYGEMGRETTLNRDQKVLAIQKELEEATALELPMLEKNLTIIATLASVATLTGLLGTVLGMIRAFAALANAGAPDTGALSTGISEALINTALGIGTSALAIIAYNYFTSKIDELTYSIDEAGVSITQNFGTTATSGATSTSGTTAGLAN